MSNIQLGSFPFQVTEISQLSKIYILSGETLSINDTFFKMFRFVNLLDLFCQLSDYSLDFVFLLY